jgi:hypothetical protein
LRSAEATLAFTSAKTLKEVHLLMRRLSPYFAAIFVLAAAVPAFASVFATVHGVVHDPQHRPIADAEVTLQAVDSAFLLRAKTSPEGDFVLSQAPIGVYLLKITAPGFGTTEQTLTVVSGTNPVLHIQLPVVQATQTIVVQGLEPSFSASDTVTPTTLITRADISQTPGASRTLGMEMITDYVPGAYMTHDMLHIRGGHQTGWLIDGIAIPNTKIASNVGPQIDPMDIDAVETQRGSYAAEVGDRTYGVFNVLPRNGFERDREGELLLTGGNLGTGESQLSLGDHSEKSAWYTSLTGSRSDYGLATPVANIDHDATNSESGFVSLIRNQTPKDQLRLDAQLRQDYFDVPYDPSSTDYECTSGYYCSWGLRDAQTERDSFVIANWVHTVSPRAIFSAAPFYHFNLAKLDSLPSDLPVASTWQQTSNYLGGQVDSRLDAGRNNFSAGANTFYQFENDLYGVIVNDGSATSEPNQSASGTAGLIEFYLSDHLRVNRSITLLGGERFSFYHGGYNESALYPRIGATVAIPRLHWVLRGFYGHFFQPAPLITVSESARNYASTLPSASYENAFAPLPSERDEEHQFGIFIPYKGWSLDMDTVKNRVNNFLDHSNLGESSMYFPIAVHGALIRAWELTLRSPQLAKLGRFHLTYSNQIAQQRGDIIGGFICNNGNPGNPSDGTPCDLGPNYIALDHDQRDTLNTGFTANLPWQSWFSTNVYYGSGFSNGLAGQNEGPYNGPYLPVHTTFDASVGHAVGEQWKFAVNLINVTNHRVLQDNSVTIGGFHFNDPRMIQAEMRYRFHF